MMKRTLKILTTAALLTLGAATMSSFAAGWAMEGNSWVYLDNNGKKLTNEWKKGADDLWRYLGSDGKMAISCWVDDDYYVDSNGIMVANNWVKTRPQDDRWSDEQWFYFGNSGKFVRDNWRTINGKSYLFDEDGVMQTGWTDDYLYYLGEDGAMETGWEYLESPRDEYDRYDIWDDYLGPETFEGKYWFYFGSNGKKYCPETSSRDRDNMYRVSLIGNDYYCFDEYGRMMSGWVYMNGHPDEAPHDTIENWRYFAEEGIANIPVGCNITGWLSLEPPTQLRDFVNSQVLWYYFNKEGIPEIGPEYGSASTRDFLRVDGKTYLFDKKGNPVSGLHKVQIGTSSTYSSYYFDENSKTTIEGEQKIYEGDGTRSEFYFSDGSYSGRGLNGVRDNALYYMGKKQEAENGFRYQIFTVAGKNYVVSESGRVAKNKTVTDSDGYKLTTNKSGVLIKIDGSTAGTSAYFEPVAPAFEEWDR